MDYKAKFRVFPTEESTNGTDPLGKSPYVITKVFSINKDYSLETRIDQFIKDLEGTNHEVILWEINHV